ncbi:MAG: SRPBCC family protein [Spirosomataceae bacterium]
MKTSKNLMGVSDQDKEIVLDPSNYSYLNISKSERVISFVVGAAATVYGAYLSREKDVTKNGHWYKLAVLPFGVYLVKRGITGYCMINNLIGRNTADKEDFSPLELSADITVDKPRWEVFEQWKSLQTLPELFPHLKKVEVTDQTHSDWTLVVPNTPIKIHWTAEMIDLRPGEKISWKSIEGSDIGNAGEVNFTDAENGGTRVSVSIRYIPPAGKLGKNVADFFTEAIQRKLISELEVFSQRQETE